MKLIQPILKNFKVYFKPKQKSNYHLLNKYHQSKRGYKKNYLKIKKKLNIIIT